MSRHALPLEDETLLHLTALSQLSELCLHRSPESDVGVPSAAAVQQFKAAMPQLRNLIGL